MAAFWQPLFFLSLLFRNFVPNWLIHMMRFLIFLAVVLIPVCCESDPEWHSVGNLDVHTEWMELPAMHGVPLDYYTHSFVLKKKTYRNYSFAPEGFPLRPFCNGCLHTQRFKECS